jgi:hypothetical protein
LNAVIAQACTMVNSLISTAVYTGIGDLSSALGPAGTILGSTAAGALYGGQQGAANGLVGSTASVVGSAIGSTSIGGLSISPTSTLMNGLAASGGISGLSGPVSQTAVQQQAATIAQPANTLIQQLFGGGSSTTESPIAGAAGSSVAPVTATPLAAPSSGGTAVGTSP